MNQNRKMTIIPRTFIAILTMFLMAINMSFANQFISLYQDGRPLTDEVKAALLYTQSDLILSEIIHGFERFLPGKSMAELSDWSYGSEEILSNLTFAEIQLDDSPRKEVMVLFQSPGYCGSGGCSGLLLKLDSDLPSFLGEVFLSGSIVPPVIGPGAGPEHGFYDFAISGDAGIYVYTYNPATGEYHQKK